MKRRAKTHTVRLTTSDLLQDYSTVIILSLLKELINLKPNPTKRREFKFINACITDNFVVLSFDRKRVQGNLA